MSGKTYAKFVLLGIVCAIIVALAISCAPAAVTDIAPFGVQRYVDKEAGVVCYLWADGTGRAMSCLDIDLTELPR